MRNALILLAIRAVALLTCFFVLSCDHIREGGGSILPSVYTYPHAV